MNKKVIAFCAALSTFSLFFGCGDDTPSSSNNNININAIVTDAPAFFYDKGDIPLLITSEGIVKDTAGNIIGTADFNSGLIVSLEGTPLAEGVVFGELDTVNPTIIVDNAWVLTADQNYVIYPNGFVTNASGNTIGTIVFFTDPTTGQNTSIGNIVALDGSIIFENVDVATLRVYGPNTVIPTSSAAEPPVASSESTIPPEPVSSAITQPASSSSAQVSSSSSAQVSSSSSARSSSSKAKSSSSQQVSINLKVKSGGRSGQGWGSRYWDCCMPHCAWKGNTSNPTKTCDANMNPIDESGGSVCNGGSGGVCDMQAPWAANEKLAFAFAAVPAALGGECGKCFLLTFDGKSHNGGSKANTSGLSGKQMVIMVSNIGGDVNSNQFDIMIPGGGVGQFNGCGAQLGIPSTGAQYGGFITDCKSDPSCVKQKCSVFSKYPKLQAGCEFSATWMGGADNPSFKFEELESCPSEISSKW